MSGAAGQSTDDHERLRRMFTSRARDLTIEPLGGGLAARCYRVEGDGLDCAVRLRNPVRSDFRLDPEAEKRLLRTLAAAGIAPPPVEIDAGPGALVTQFLPGAVPWTPTDARAGTNIRRLAARLEALHAIETELKPFEAVAAAEAYTRAAAAHLDLHEEQRRWRSELLRLAEAFARRFPATTLCHNDLVASNILDDGHLWLLDFEYAALGDPILDLASVAGLNDFASPQRAELVSAYYAGKTVPFTPEELDEVIRWLRLLAYFWALARGSEQRDARSFEAFAGQLAAVLR
ncbi:MAG TPA: choline/ethanolamine kinase family protein [Gammaproteobacteria bacterium]